MVCGFSFYTQSCLKLHVTEPAGNHCAQDKSTTSPCPPSWGAWPFWGACSLLSEHKLHHDTLDSVFLGARCHPYVGLG